MRAWLFGFLFALRGLAAVETLDLDVISYADFIAGDPQALAVLERALHEKGIAGIRSIPGYRERVEKLIFAARAFSLLPEEIKQTYAPNKALGEICGYERGKEKFQRSDGNWVVDDLKVSYYGFVPDNGAHRWPVEVDVETPFEELGSLMSEVGREVMERIGLLGEKTGISLGSTPRTGRMLHYQKHAANQNPFWCGAHFDHSIFTALLPAFYFVDGKPIAEPAEAGLFVNVNGAFRKVIADDPDVLLFQVGEFGQLATNDAICATEHRVQKPRDERIERYTMALFFDAPEKTVIRSTSRLTQDARYGNEPSGECVYGDWCSRSFARYAVSEPQTTTVEAGAGEF